jgi:hypothetical protein
LFGLLASGFGAAVLLFSVVPAGAAGAAAAPAVQPSKSCGNYCAVPSPTTSQNAHPDGSVGNADNKNPKGQSPNGTDNNKGYECDKNKGIGDGNPAHTVNCPSPARINVTIGQLHASWPCGAANPSYTVPVAPAHAVYSIAPGTYAGVAGAIVAVSVVYDAGYTGPSSFSVSLPSAPAPCNSGTLFASPVAPSVTDSVCVNGSPSMPTFTVPNTPNIVYSPPSGTYPGTPGSSTTVTASAASGYSLAVGAQSAFGITFAAVPVCTTATTSPSPSPLAGGGGGGATAPSPKATKPTKAVPVAGGGGGPAVHQPVAGGGALPFTGDGSSSLVPLGFGLILGGLFLTMLARRRVVVA